MRSIRRGSVLIVATVLAAAACSSDEPADVIATTVGGSSEATDAPTTNVTTAAPAPASTAGSTAPVTTAAPVTTPSTSAAPVPSASVPPLLALLASDELRGRDNGTPDGAAARDAILAALAPLAAPWNPAAPGVEGYLQPFDAGTNVIGVIAGTDLAEEYVVVGAHYDHLAVGDCRFATADDQICNGAADNAAGVAAAMAIAEQLSGAPLRRSVIVAFWDAEEDGLLGSQAFVGSPVVPLDRVVAYVNFDIQGARLLPSLAGDTLAIGAETGGQALVDLVGEVTAASPLRYSQFSRILGQDRSDHAPFAAASVPIVFLGDSTNGCYHSVDDELEMLDLDKLAAQIATATELVRRLADGDAPIAFDPSAAVTTFADAEQLLRLANIGSGDLAATDATTESTVLQIVAELDAVVAGGADAYDEVAEGIVLGAAAQLVDIITNVDCALARPA